MKTTGKRISVTTIENFSYITSIDDDEKRQARLVEFQDGLRVKVPPTRNMEVGSAVGEIIQRPQMFWDNDTKLYRRNGYEFSENTIQQIQRTVDYRGLFEVPAEKTYSGDVTVSGRVDLLLGNTVTDFKTKLCTGGKLSSYDYDKLFDRYTASVQWMYYCDMLDVQTFIYRVYCLDEDTLEIGEIVEIALHPYDDMHEYMQEKLNQLLAFIEDNQLEQYFQPKQEQLEEVMA